MMSAAPVIIRTRGHRLEGIWHSGSPMSGIVNLVRGMHVCVPRNMTQAAGFYNTLLRGDDPSLVIEVLSGYRYKERVPSNVGDFTLPLGVPEVIRPGNDVTLVTYGALSRIALETAKELEAAGIDVEVIDARTLLPFDTGGLIAKSAVRRCPRPAFPPRNRSMTALIACSSTAAKRFCRRTPASPDYSRTSRRFRAGGVGCISGPARRSGPPSRTPPFGRTACA